MERAIINLGGYLLDLGDRHILGGALTDTLAVLPIRIEPESSRYPT